MKLFILKKKKSELPALRPVEEKKSEAPIEKKEIKEAPKTYEDTHALDRLEFLITIVNESQDGAIVKILTDNNAAVAFSSHGKGTASSDLYEVFGLSNNNKHVVFSVIKESAWPAIRKGLQERFAISNYAKGVAILVDIDSVCGVSAYKFLTNTRTLTEGKGVIAVENIEKKDDYQVVMAIVNDGFTDLVMDAAKKAGARGGTILTAHGTGNTDIAKFFGVVITPEKQIVMILVPKAIKDKVIESIYKEVGINTKGQGIAFSFPCSDVVGIVSDSKPAEKPAEPPSNLQNAPK
jgi:nitrogen regulatory protein PII